MAATTAEKSAKQLAIEKGIFRQRGVKRPSKKEKGRSNASSGSSSSSLPECAEDDLRFLIVIDFESTCWPDVATERFSHQQRGQHPQEIIEFPAVLVDLRWAKPPAGKRRIILRCEMKPISV